MKKLTTIFKVLAISFYSVSLMSQAGPDKTFGGKGSITRAVSPGYDIATATAVQDDGKILVAGYATTGGTGDFIMIRYLPNGGMDVAFGDSGTVITDLGKTELPFAIALQPDGKILLAGQANPGSNADFAIMRYKPNGQPDSSFDADGVVTAPIGNFDDVAQAVTLQADGKIVVAGYAMGSNADFAIARFHSDGRIDSSFSTDGKTIRSLGTNADYANAVKVQANGKIVVSGRYVNGGAYDIGVLRYNADGSPDFGFGTTGMATVSIGIADDMGFALAIQTDQKILIAGSGNTGSYSDFAVVRLDSTGLPDPGFSTDGKQTISIGAEDDLAYAMVLQPDGKIVLGGNSKSGTKSEFALARLKADGSPDSSFGNAGKAKFAVGNTYDVILSMDLQQDGKIIAAGISSNGTDYDFAIARYIPGRLTSVHNSRTDYLRPLIYPNPVSGPATLEFDLEKETNLQIELIDMQGKLIHRFFDGEIFDHGLHRVALDLPENLNADMYVLKMTDGKSVSVLRFVVTY